jgi:TATA-box binding protein (TBP) (component of TFIID and TFIIIB)
MKRVYLILLISLLYPLIIKCSIIWQNDYLIGGGTAICYPEKIQEYYSGYELNTYYTSMICMCILIIISATLFYRSHYLCQKEIVIKSIDKIVIESYFEAKQFLKNHNITISSITLSCKLNTFVDIDKFAKNVTLQKDKIASVNKNNNKVTIRMKPTNNPIGKYVSIWLNVNGFLVMTGCKDINDFYNVTATLIDILKHGEYIKEKNNEKFTHIDFIDNPIRIDDVKIRTINSNFKLDYKFNRIKLEKLLKKNHQLNTNDKEIGYVECVYESTDRNSFVNIKYKYDDKNKPSIFLFQTGAVIITGAKNLHHIIMAYHFIHKILNTYYNEIKIIDLDHKATHEEISTF